MNALEQDRLGTWLRERVAPFHGPIRLQALSGGQSNPTYAVEAGEHRWVLRRKPPGTLLASAHAVDREYRVMAALADTGVPVPRMHALCTDESVIGSMFVVMEHVQGRVLVDPALPGCTPAERAAIFDAMAQCLARLHRVDPSAVGLSDYGRPQRYLSRQLERWTRQYRASQTEAIASMERVMGWLHAELPRELDEHPGALIHGDFRLDNLILHPTEPRVLALIDWELSTLGLPWADLAYHLMTWRLAPDEFRGLRGHDLPALGIPDEAAQRARYLAAAGVADLPPHAQHYLMVFNLFRMACILQGILARAMQGNAAASDALATGQRARRLADAAWRAVAGDA